MLVLALTTSPIPCPRHCRLPAGPFAGAGGGILAVPALVAGGSRKILIDLSPVTYVDSATIGCLMDLYRQVHNAGGHLKLSGVQKRVETMLTMTGAQNFIEIHADEPSAVKSFGA